jgi:hypothetical protein
MDLLTFGLPALIVALSFLLFHRATDIRRAYRVPQAEDLSDEFIMRWTTGRLWWALLRFRIKWVGLQWALALLDAMMGFASRYCLLTLLQHLEKEHSHRPGRNGGLMLYVCGFGVALCLEAMVRSGIQWVTTAQLEIPVRALISSLVFRKAFRQSDTHSRLGQAKEPSGNLSGGVTRYSLITLMKLDRYGFVSCDSTY